MERVSEIALRTSLCPKNPECKDDEGEGEPIDLTLWEKFMLVKKTTWFKSVRRAIILIIYFIVGVLVYSSYEKWSVGTSLSFIIVTISTVGFGYHVPTSDGTRLFTAFYMVFGIYAVFLFISDAVTQNFSYYADLLTQKLKSATEMGQEYRNNFLLMLANVLALVVCIIVGAIILMSLEGWSFASSIYFAVQTSTTVGYGDLEVRHGFTHPFLAFYIVFSTVLFAFAFKNLQSLRIRRKQLHKLESLVEKRKQLDFLSELDVGAGVTEEQFVLAILLHFGTISYEADVRPWIEKFAAMDQLKQGRLFRQNLVDFTFLERAMAADDREQLEKSRTISVLSLTSSLDPRPSFPFKTWAGTSAVASTDLSVDARSQGNPIHSSSQGRPSSVDTSTSSRRMQV